MRRLFCFLLTTCICVSGLWAQTRVEAPTETAVYAVTYVEVMPASKGTAVAALKQYRDSSRKDEGYVRLDFWEQIGRPGHFAIIERWTDQKAFDAHGMAEHTKHFLSGLQPIRVSDYDQRPYKTLAVGPAPAAENGQSIHFVAHVDFAGPQSDSPGILRRFAEASRKDEGSLRFDVLQGATRANHFTVIESWQSQKAHDAHAAAVHTKQYRDGLHSITGSPLDERVYKVVE
jgi:quinol monooxygenase YgiN